jgi:ATP-binding cassette subfamily F protein uup
VNLVSVEKAVKAYGPRVLLDSVSLGVTAGERIGVVGRNGVGKSTLLALLAGALEPDTGRVSRQSGLRVGYLPQRDSLAGSVGEAVFGPGGAAGERWAADPRARSVMSELLPGVDLDGSASSLSGGERRRAGLAALLVAERDLLLLDEPTNHLDIEAIDWLGRHLRDRGCAVVVVSHDRWLLDTVCDRTWEVVDGRVYATEGGYSAYTLAQAERSRGEEAADRRRRSLARKELAWLRRGPQARSTKPKFRVREANELIAAEPPLRDRVELSRLATARLGKTVIDIEDVTLCAGSRVLLSDVTWGVGPGERVGLVGVNGTGKTSLLRLLAGELSAEPDGVSAEGKVVRGTTVRLGHLSQELDELDPALRVREAVEEVRLHVQLGKRELSAGQLLERLGFRGDRQWTPVRDLSGGERRRLQMLRLLMAEPNVLLLDEPTNDLDIETLTEFEDLLDGWPGTLVVVSHDRYFLERVTDHVVALLGDGKLAFLPGGVDAYLDRVRQARSASGARGGPGASAEIPVRADDGAPVSSAASERAARKELASLERRIDRASRREAELGVAMAENATDYEKLTAMGAELRTVQAEKADLEERWLSIAGTLDA